MSLMDRIDLAKRVVTSTAGKQILLGKKHSPTILFVGGVVGFGATVILASKATLNLEAVLDENDEYKNTAEENLTNPEFPTYDYKTYKQDMRQLHVKSVTDLVKLYAPAAGAGVFALACFGQSHRILTQRNAAITAAYVAVDTAFKQYRGRVTELFGEEVDRELRHPQEYKSVMTTTEEGEPVEEIIRRPRTEDEPSMYARFFQQGNQNWNDSPEYNIMFLKMSQNWMNDQLQAKGVVLLNDVYDQLGMARTKPGCVVGWVLDKDNPDNFIDFGIFDQTDGVQAERLYNFVTGREGAVLLDFNVDGIVYEKI